MKLTNMLIIAFLFIFSIFIIGDVETSIGTLGSEALQPVLNIFPILFIGCVFVAIVYVGFKD